MLKTVMEALSRCKKAVCVVKSELGFWWSLRHRDEKTRIAAILLRYRHGKLRPVLRKLLSIRRLCKVFWNERITTLPHFSGLCKVVKPVWMLLKLLFRCYKLYEHFHTENYIGLILVLYSSYKDVRALFVH